MWQLKFAVTKVGLPRFIQWIQWCEAEALAVLNSGSIEKAGHTQEMKMEDKKFIWTFRMLEGLSGSCD